MNKLLAILLIACFSYSSCNFDISEEPEGEESLTIEKEDTSIKQTFMRILEIENCDSVEFIDGVDIRSKYTHDYSYFKYKANKGYIFSIIKNLPLGQNEIEKNYMSHSNVNPISWGEMKSDFWQMENVKNKECYECVRPPVTHRIVIDTYNDIIHHMVKPLMKGEYAYNFNPQIERLENMLDDSLAQMNHREFYRDTDWARDWYVYPIKFPYKIVQFESNYATFVCKDENYGCNFSFVKLGCHGGYISKFNFDKNYILLELADCFTTIDSNVMKYEKIKPALDKYVIVNMNTCEKTFFKTYEKMCKKAYKLNYQGDSKLITVDEYEELFYTKNE